VFHPGEDVLQVSHDAYGLFIAENGLGPAAFPSLKRMEREVVDMALGLQHAPEEAAGSMTSGGSESIFMAVKACRDWSRANRAVAGVPQIVVPYSAHPAFDKAAHLLGLEVIRVPLASDLLADTDAMAQALTERVIMLVGSAPCFPYGLIDPIAALSDLALDRGLWLHVDACVGGYLSPFVAALGESLPEWDFRLAGVSSMSLDLHKYGYAAKGASTVLYRRREQRDAQVFHFDDWPCGHMFTPTLAGTRPGGAIAAAWAVLNYLGHEGYVARARRILEARHRLCDGLDALGLRVFGAPRLSIVAFGAKPEEPLDMLAVGEGLYRDGWFSSRVRDPDGIQVMLSPEHQCWMDDYLEVLGRWLARGRSGTLARGSNGPRYS
jgi:glutamate/tyrosine decarboxylase-like PLP-dependent enzyme